MTEEIKDETYFRLKEEYLSELQRLKQELKWANDEEKYLKDCCIKAGKELEKHSFRWDGKEKNLVVQALQLNQLYEKLEQENKELKEKIIELSEEKGHLIVENNTLKESNQSLSMLGTDLVSANETVRKEFFRADKNKDMWRETAENYRSALEKIGEYINRCRASYCDSNCEYWGNCKGNYNINNIYNKINEVLQ